MTKELNANDLNRAKNLLKMDVLVALERQTDRLEEAAKNVNTFGKV